MQRDLDFAPPGPRMPFRLSGRTRPQPPARGLLRTLSLVLVLGLGLVVPSSGDEAGSWQVLTAVRSSLVDAGPTRADFTQTFIPAGFSSGDVESGTLSLDLPACLRWDYTEPYAKAFLLCDDTAYLWNPGDPTGRRYTVDREREPGLDLVLLSVDQLRQRYRIESEAPPGDASRLIVRLVPRQGSAEQGPSEITEARLEIDRETDRVVGLAYTDDEGNETRFEIDDYRSLGKSEAPSPFVPPSDLEWTEEEP